MEEVFRSALLANSSVSLLVGTRIDFGGNPSGSAYPRIVLWTIDDSEDHNMNGPDGLSVGRIQADCYAETYAAAKTLSRAVRAAMDGYSSGGFQGVFLAGSRDTREGGSNEAERPFRSSLDFITHYNF